MLGRKPDGKPDRPKIYAGTREEVRRKLAELKRKAEQGTRADPVKERQTVGQFMETWLRAARTSIRPQTWSGYERVVRVHIVPTLGRTKLSALRPDTIQKLYAEKLVEGLAPLTLRKSAKCSTWLLRWQWSGTI